jgi:glyoxylase-like metal-dependent hydrolase (beta-lactamase superfamily II)
MLQGSLPQAILITHSHADHIGALSSMRAELGVPVLAHRGSLSDAAQFEANEWITDGDELPVGAERLRVHHTPGHTHDQVCYALVHQHMVVVGDTIFEGGPGRTWSAEGFRTTLKTLRDIVLTWPDETICHPGHGPHFRLGDRRKDIATFLRNASEGFFGDATWDMWCDQC